MPIANRSHLPFLEELDNPFRPQSSEEVTAGLLVLRVVDALIAGDSPASWGIEEVGNLVDRLDQHSLVKPHLLRATDFLRADSVVEADVAAALVRYARVLENSANWILAIDVYRTVLRAPSIQEDPVAVHCWLRVGQCNRNLNAQRRAARAFKRSAILARRIGDEAGYLLAKIGQTRISILRGNLSTAQRRFNLIIRRARRLGLTQVESKALHDRGEIDYLNGRYIRGLPWMFAALRLCTDKLEKERIDSEIALGFLNIGLIGAARYGFTILAQRGQEQLVRWAAHGNLLEVTSRSGDIVAFQRHARFLAGEKLPPFICTKIQVVLAEGYRRFGDLRAHADHLRQALALACEHGFGQIVIEIEEAIQHSLAMAPGPVHTVDSDSDDAERVDDPSDSARPARDCPTKV